MTSIGTILILTILCIIFRGILFQKHDIKWWKTFIPFKGLYLMGKISNSKKLGIINAILIPLSYIYFIACIIFEIWLYKTYTLADIKVSTNIEENSIIEVTVPEYIANIAIISKYVLILLYAITIICWTIMMIKFLKIQHRTYWWIFAWVLAPVIPYCYFAFTKKLVINGKSYVIKKVLEDEQQQE